MERWLLGIMATAIGFMVMQYFLRVEKHLGNLHKLRNWLQEVRLRVWRIEKHLDLPPIDDDEPKEE